MKLTTATILYALAMLVILAVAVLGLNNQQAYKTGWMDGYRTQQIENLPAPGVERVKRPNPELVTKTGRG